MIEDENEEIDIDLADSHPLSRFIWWTPQGTECAAIDCLDGTRVNILLISGLFSLYTLPIIEPKRIIMNGDSLSLGLITTLSGLQNWSTCVPKIRLVIPRNRRGIFTDHL